MLHPEKFVSHLPHKAVNLLVWHSTMFQFLICPEMRYSVEKIFLSPPVWLLMNSYCLIMHHLFFRHRLSMTTLSTTLSNSWLLQVCSAYLKKNVFLSFWNVTIESLVWQLTNQVYYHSVDINSPNNWCCAMVVICYFPFESILCMYKGISPGISVIYYRTCSVEIHQWRSKNKWQHHNCWYLL